MKHILHVLTLIVLCGCSVIMNGEEAPCSDLYWIGGKHETVDRFLENSSFVSIFAVFSGAIAPGSSVQIDGQLVEHQGRLFLVPLGSPQLVKTFKDRVEIVVEEPLPFSEASIRNGGLVLVAGVLRHPPEGWIIEDPALVRSVHRAPEIVLGEIEDTRTGEGRRLRTHAS